MSTYKFELTKRHIVSTEDSSQYSPDAESYEDSADETESQQDIDITVYLDDVAKATVTVGDAGVTASFDADVSAAAHTIRIASPTDPTGKTNVCVDTMWIGDKKCVASQYNFNSAISGTTSTLRQMLSQCNAQPHDHVWWGHTQANDSTLNLVGPFYRPTIVANHASEWHMDFTKTASGRMWISNPGDVNDIMYDSTAQHTYYFVQADDSEAVDTAWQSYRETVRGTQTVDDSTYENITQGHMEDLLYKGPGTYATDSTSLVYQNNSIDISAEDANSVVVLSLPEYVELCKGLCYHRNYTVTPITLT